MEAPKNANRFRHGLRRKQSGAEDTFAKPRDFTVLMDFLEATSVQARNFQPNRIRSDIDGGKSGHRRFRRDEQYCDTQGSSDEPGDSCALIAWRASLARYRLNLVCSEMGGG